LFIIIIIIIISHVRLFPLAFYFHYS